MAMVFCRGCGKEVDETASFCPHCGAEQNAQSSIELSPPRPPVDYGIFLLAVPIIATIAMWFTVGQMSALQAPEIILTGIMLVAVIVTALIAVMEANKVGMTSDRSKGTYKASTWFLGILLLWFYGYPAYLYKRKHYGLPNLLVPGLLVAAIFIGVNGFMQSVIDDQRKSLGLDISEVKTAPASETTSTESSTEFNCAEQPGLAKSVDPTIVLLDHIRPINKEEKEAIAMHRLLRTGVQQTLGQDNGTSQFVLSQKVPGKLMGICVAEAYYQDSTDHKIVYSVSSVNSDIYVSIQDYTELQGALMLMELSKEEEQDNAETSVEKTQVEHATGQKQEGLTNAAKDSFPPGLSLSEVKQQAASSEQIKPSFNCEQATARIDKIICQSPELAKLDVQVYESYKEAIKTTSADQTAQLVNSQKEWIKKRNQCDSVQCITDAYEQRDQELAPWDYE